MKIAFFILPVVKSSSLPRMAALRYWKYLLYLFLEYVVIIENYEIEKIDMRQDGVYPRLKTDAVLAYDVEIILITS